jgi:hypothetical protein
MTVTAQLLLACNLAVLPATCCISPHVQMVLQASSCNDYKHCPGLANAAPMALYNRADDTPNTTCNEQQHVLLAAVQELWRC